MLNLLAAAIDTTDVKKVIDYSFLYSLGGSAGLISILGYFVKKWINGTGESIKSLEMNKVNKESCSLTEANNQQEFTNITSHFVDLKENQKDIKNSLDELMKLIISIQTSQLWDGKDRRK